MHMHAVVCVCVCVCVCQRKTKDRADGMIEKKSADSPRRDSNLYLCVCVCVCKRERERERESSLPRVSLQRLQLSNQWHSECHQIDYGSVLLWYSVGDEVHSGTHYYAGLRLQEITDGAPQPINQRSPHRSVTGWRRSCVCVRARSLQRAGPLAPLHSPLENFGITWDSD